MSEAEQLFNPTVAAVLIAGLVVAVLGSFLFADRLLRLLSYARRQADRESAFLYAQVLQHYGARHGCLGARFSGNA